jgi:hypothetical protein
MRSPQTSADTRPESSPPPGWAEKVGWLRSIVDRAERQIETAAREGGPTLVAEQKREVAYRNLEALMAMRPRLPLTGTALTQSLADQCKAETERQAGWRETTREDGSRVWGPAE